MLKQFICFYFKFQNFSSKTQENPKITKRKNKKEKGKIIKIMYFRMARISVN